MGHRLAANVPASIDTYYMITAMQCYLTLRSKAKQSMHVQAATLGAIRLNNSIEHPLGVGGMDSNPLCIPFRGAKLRALAVVGNGPIDEKQRREISTFDLVIRCAHFRPKPPSLIMYIRWRNRRMHRCWKLLPAARPEIAAKQRIAQHPCSLPKSSTGA